MASPSRQVPNSMEEALKENQELRAALAQAQSDLKAALETAGKQTAAAQTLSEQLQQFLYAASHDLQEPLRGIITYTQLLEQKLDSQSTPMHDYTSVVLNSAGRMRELLQQLLVYSRAGVAKQRVTVDLNVPLQMALLALASQIKSADARVESRSPLPKAIGNERELAQVFQNILSNSLKYRSEEPPAIVVSAEQGSDECQVSIRDNGLGVDPRFCQQVLLPFKRLHGGASSSSGLGLAICEKILRAHNGRIWLESDGAHGATVHFTLPC